MSKHTVRTGYRPEQRGDRWGITHDKDYYRDCVRTAEWETREAAEEWITQHRVLLERHAEASRERTLEQRKAGADRIRAWIERRRATG